MRQPGPAHVVGFPGLLHGDFLRGPLHHPALADAQVPVDRLLPLRGQDEGKARPGRPPPAPAPPPLGVPSIPPPRSAPRRAARPSIPARLPLAALPALRAPRALGLGQRAARGRRGAASAGAPRGADAQSRFLVSWRGRWRRRPGWGTRAARARCRGVGRANVEAGGAGCVCPRAHRRRPAPSGGRGEHGSPHFRNLLGVEFVESEEREDLFGKGENPLD